MKVRLNLSLMIDSDEVVFEINKMSWWVQNHFRWVWISSVHSLISTTFIDYQIKDQPIFIVNGSFEKSLLTW